MNFKIAKYIKEKNKQNISKTDVLSLSMVVFDLPIFSKYIDQTLSQPHILR